MNHDLNLTRAQALDAVRTFCIVPSFLREIDQARVGMATPLPDHRLNQLATSLAWHASRPTAPARLEEGARELARLWKRARQSAHGEASLYTFLTRKLGLDAELHLLRQRVEEQQAERAAQIAAETDVRTKRTRERELRPQLQALAEAHVLYTKLLDQLIVQDRPWSAVISSYLHLPAAQAQVWQADLRLRVALAAVQALQVLQTTAPLQEQIEQEQATKGVFPWR